ncbi:MAG: hypothetical protein OXE77_00905 [Flavobacteriaceae bacterium]|nr:hypothetical protein [Flavobacteriaceae bacterium]MCY4267667.1 hypothetical protein [Flavobacteriaceae bacterium]
MKKGAIFFTGMILFIMGSCSRDSENTSEPTPIPNPTPQVVESPSPASLSSPANNQVCETGVTVSGTHSSVPFQWTAGNHTESYDLTIVDLNANQSINQNNLTATQKSVVLKNGTPYAWKVTSKNTKTNQTAVSARWMFYLSSEGMSTYPPFPPILISPTQEEKFSSDTESIELNWEGSHPEETLTSSIVYDLYFDTVDGLQDPISANQKLSKTSQTVQVNQQNTYYWRLKATDQNHNSSYSQIHTFIIE